MLKIFFLKIRLFFKSKSKFFISRANFNLNVINHVLINKIKIMYCKCNVLSSFYQCINIISIMIFLQLNSLDLLYKKFFKYPLKIKHENEFWFISNFFIKDLKSEPLLWFNIKNILSSHYLIHISDLIMLTSFKQNKVSFYPNLDKSFMIFLF